MVELAYGVGGVGVWARLTTQNKKGVISFQSPSDELRSLTGKIYPFQGDGLATFLLTPLLWLLSLGIHAL
jgi:hypothetical protein